MKHDITHWLTKQEGEALSPLLFRECNYNPVLTIYAVGLVLPQSAITGRYIQQVTWKHGELVHWRELCTKSLMERVGRPDTVKIYEMTQTKGEEMWAIIGAIIEAKVTVDYETRGVI